MINIGKFNTLTIARENEHGLYLSDGQNNEVLLPGRFMTEDMTTGSDITVFVYTDSENRPIATTERPFAVVGEFAFLQVNDVNSVGAFLDWGIGKDLLVPFSQQKNRMHKGGIYPVYVYLDHTTNRVVASAKIEKFLGNVMPEYTPGTKVRLLVMEHAEPGYRVIVDNLHRGIVYDNELSHPLEIESSIEGYVKKVRPDGKIDIAVGPAAAERVGRLSRTILKSIEAGGGSLPLGDASSPEEIRATFHCSKKDFKKAIGHLYKEGKILLGEHEIALSKAN
ncbi:MAG: S1-like domain-containing RNA-binding protein [Odoribacter sp.]|nr:S1-like domain-containing RNA-binding protein [Odoribacter sp.]